MAQLELNGDATVSRGLMAALLIGLLGLAGCSSPGAKRADDAFPYKLARNADRPAPGAGGPTMRMDYRENSPGDPIGVFMYLVPLVSPDPISVQESAGNTQRSRVTGITRRFTSSTFSAECEFDFTGEGTHRNMIDQSERLRRHEVRLRAGESLARALQYISIEGHGRALIEVEGVVTGKVATVTEVRLKFNAHGETSPVSIGLADMLYKDNQLCITNDIIARVNALTFRKSEDRPRMGVTISSVRRKEASDNLWQRLKGGVAGALANYVLKPMPVESTGNDAMLDFGAALVARETTFTFPVARNLRPSGSSP